MTDVLALDLEDHLLGEVLGVVGGSGTGKSVLLRTIVGLNLDAASNVAGGTGYGRALNDNGELLLRLTLNNNASGIFVIGQP